MQDPIILSSELTDDHHQQQQQQQHLKCPRCESTNTKFCYYNNYNLSQPRHFCKNCRRYWTKGGALRNIPVGGGSRKNNSKRSSSSDSTTNPNKRRPADLYPDPLPLKPEPVSLLYPPPIDPADDGMLEIGGSFSSLLHSNGQFGNFLDVGFGSSVDPVAPAPDSGNPDPNPNPNPNPNPQLENFLGWPSGWADLTIYTSPGSTTFQ